ncbi:uncharacterized protein IUM83_03719 [Phytophthora cinnamomi]|uniref:uncharacterized protein n=1 Tax=Phytophthora cinnamomi TaxID=4785 RepID=UPI00355AC067|nr:hypothetical protein IUM83_03719 [Phytophthora cinnamomi]
MRATNATAGWSRTGDGDDGPGEPARPAAQATECRGATTETPATEEENGQPETKVANAESSQYDGGVTGGTHEKEVTAAVTKQWDTWVSTQGDSGVAGSRATPSKVQAALEKEMQAKDVERRRVLLAGASTLQDEAVQTHETDPQRRRRKKRVERTKARRERRADREHVVASAGGSGAANGKRLPTEASDGNAVREDTGNVNTAEMITYGRNDAPNQGTIQASGGVEGVHDQCARGFAANGASVVTKARAKAKRELLAWLAARECPSEAYFVFDEMWQGHISAGPDA